MAQGLIAGSVPLPPLGLDMGHMVVKGVWMEHCCVLTFPGRSNGNLDAVTKQHKSEQS